MKITSICRGVAVAAALLVLSTGAALAQGQKDSQKDSQKDPREASAAPKGPRGLLTGTVSPRIVQRADGAQEIESDESMLHTMVLVKAPDGTMKQYCVPDAEVARRLASGGSAALAKKYLEHTHDR